jgi:hypothetical protein
MNNYACLVQPVFLPYVDYQLIDHFVLQLLYVSFVIDDVDQEKDDLEIDQSIFI